MKLDPKALGLSAGLLFGTLIFALTLRKALMGIPGEHLALLGGFFPGYRMSVGGAFIGLIGGFVSAFVGAWVLGWLYNKFSSSM